MSGGDFATLKKFKNGSGDHGSGLPDSDSSSVGTGSELADRDNDLDDPGLGPGMSVYTPADMEKEANKNSKKTKGRVKIKMEFIDNKLRRYTTFSKRKTGIMKKAYELSTLTGTQVMLLVASETGHVYTFATRKLQPMITSESGKALIQTCLNSPDIPSDNHHHSNPDQRMCATGFEETELSYQVSDEEEGKSSLFTVTNVPGAGADANINTSSSSGLTLAGTGHTYPMTTYLPTSSSAQVGGAAKVNTSVAGGIPVSVPQGATFATLLSSGVGQALAPGQALQPAGVLQVQQGHSQLQLQANAQAQAGSAPSTFYRLPQGAALTAPASQMVTALVPSAVPVASTSTTTQPSQSANAVTMLTAQQSSMGSANANAIAAPLMYQTPQGVVYAASPAGTVNTLPEGFVFNYQTAATPVQQISQANIEGSSTTPSTGSVTTMPVQLHLACHQPPGTTTMQVSNVAKPPQVPTAQKRTATTARMGGGEKPDSAPVPSKEAKSNT